MFIEVEENPNCETSVFLRFKELGPAQRLRQVKSYERSSRGEWCDVVGGPIMKTVRNARHWRNPLRNPDAGRRTWCSEEHGGYA